MRGGEREGGSGVSSGEARRVAFASFIGTTIEWYDFFIYGTAAALVFGQLFFPGFSELAGTLAAFASFAVGFIARPLGGVIFAHFGDRVGRKPMLVWSLMIMGVATLLMGLLPTYEAIGVWAPILLVALRFMQGIGVGGEWGGAALMSVEHAPSGRRGFYGSWPQVGVPTGLLLGTGVFALVSSLVTDAQFTAWGWRVPFLLSALLIVVGLFIRLKISESPVFERVMERREEARMPVLEALRAYPRTIALATGSFIGTHATFYVATVWMVSYATGQVGYERTTVLGANTLLSASDILFILAFGALSDLVGRRPLFLAGMAVLALFAFPYLWLVESGAIALFILGGLVVQACRSAVYGPQSAYFSELFGTRVRYSGASLSYQIASILGGGFAPLICTSLVAWTGSSDAVAVYIIAVALISFISSYLLSETYRRDLAGKEAASAGTVAGRAAER
ncbi:MFS transporter [Rubrobacter xylanophilus]|uniref:MFS transporter n=1 Tax=Rubrobacter xylanophilus TaxID=49319 RepID=UPI001C63D59F